MAKSVWGNVAKCMCSILRVFPSPPPLQRELEHQQRQRQLAELTSRAVRHYEQVLVRSKGLKPWRRFVELVRGQCSRAGAFHEHWLLRGAFLPWRSATVLRVQEKEAKADSLRRVALMRRAMQTWKQVTSCMGCDGTEDLGSPTVTGFLSTHLLHHCK